MKSKSSITYKKGDTSNVVTKGTFLMSVDIEDHASLTRQASAEKISFVAGVLLATVSVTVNQRTFHQ